MATTLLGDDIEEYLSLVRAFPLIPIRDDEHLAAAIAVFGPLFEKENPTPAEEAYWMVLADLIERYEDETVKIPRVSGGAVVKHLLEARGEPQSALIPIFGTSSLVSEVLNGKRGRRLTVEHIKGLARHFNVAPATFIDV